MLLPVLKSSLHWVQAPSLQTLYLPRKTVVQLPSWAHQENVRCDKQGFNWLNKLQMCCSIGKCRIEPKQTHSLKLLVFWCWTENGIKVPVVKSTSLSYILDEESVIRLWLVSVTETYWARCQKYDCVALGPRRSHVVPGSFCRLLIAEHELCRISENMLDMRFPALVANLRTGDHVTVYRILFPL